MIQRFDRSSGICVLVLLALSGCYEGHALPGTREELIIDGGADGAIEDAGEDAGLPDAGPPPPEPCEVTQCQGATGLFGDMPACCTLQEQCGLDFTALGVPDCLQRDAPGQITAACPAADIFGLLQFPGCCAPSGMCGVNVNSFLPLGCMVGETGIPGFPVGPPQPCVSTLPPD
jgi:hypothetical protein